MSDWKPDPILETLLFWITYLLVFSSLPLVGVLFDGESYRWGTVRFGEPHGATDADLKSPRALAAVNARWKPSTASARIST